VLQAELPVLVDFWADWCTPCRTMAPALERLAEELAGRVRIVKVDVETDPEIAARYDIVSLPAMLLFVGGEMREQLLGQMPGPRIVALIEPHLP
jgi:thioredoxin 1